MYRIKIVNLPIIVVMFTPSFAFSSLEHQEIYCLQNNLSSPMTQKASACFMHTPSPLGTLTVTTDPHALLAAAEETRNHLHSHHMLKTYTDMIKSNYPPNTIASSFNIKKSIFTVQAEKTLNFIIWAIKDDIKHQRTFRILDPQFLTKNFSIISWKPDTQRAQEKKVALIDKDHIHVTRYAIFTASGSINKTSATPCALYALTNKEAIDTIRFRFTKQEVVAGAFEKPPFTNSVKPLVWLDREDLEQALMQGTISVTMPNGTTQFFTVDKNNGIDYDQRIKNKHLQKRYWYFKPIKQTDSNSRSYVIKHPNVMLAGDIFTIGLGKLIALHYTNHETKQKEIRLCLLTDTGGAFTNNLYQVDLFAGTFANPDELYAQTRHLPKNAQAYVMVKK